MRRIVSTSQNAGRDSVYAARSWRPVAIISFFIHVAICVFSQCTLMTPPGTLLRMRIAA